MVPSRRRGSSSRVAPMRAPVCERVSMVVVLLAVLLGCKKRPEPTEPGPTAPTVSTTEVRAAEIVPKLKARMDLLSTIAKTARKEPKVKKERPLKTKLETKQFIVIGEKWLDDVHYEPTSAELSLRDTTLSLCGHALKATPPKDDDLRYADECLAWQYVAVIRTRKIVMPVVNMEKKTFKPGQLDGDLLLFDLADGAIVGRYLLGIMNSDELTWFEGKPADEWTEESKRDLVKNVRGVIEERLQLERDSSGTPD